MQIDRKRRNEHGKEVGDARPRRLVSWCRRLSVGGRDSNVGSAVPAPDQPLRNSTIRFVLVPLALFSTPQQLAVFVNS